MISSEEINTILQNNKTVERKIIFSLKDFDYNCFPLDFKDCIFIDKFEVMMDEIESYSRFENCLFIHVVYLFGTYFRCGCKFLNNRFKDGFFLFAGGHNTEGDIVFEGNQFDQFVDFTDCSFYNKIIVKNNNFKVGSNLMGNLEKPYRCSFHDSPPILENNVGDLSINTD